MAFSATFRPLSAIFLHSYTHSAGRKLFQCVRRSETFSLICNMTIFIRYLRVTHILRCEKGVFGPFWPFFYVQIHTKWDEKGLNVFVSVRPIHRYTICLYLYDPFENIKFKVQNWHSWPFLAIFRTFFELP